MFEGLRGRKVQAIDEDIYSKFSVMIPLIRKEDGIHVLFEQRASRLKRQPGEICFPGGGRDPGETPLENAVRETMEELLIERKQIHVIAEMDYMLTVYQNKISAFMCELTDYEMQFSEAEVARVFTVPLRFFLNTQPEVHYNTIIARQPEDFPFDKVPGGRNYPWRNGKAGIYFYYYEDQVIWGLTAYIMQGVIKTLKKEAGLKEGDLI